MISNDASLKVERMNFYEIFINMYLREVRQLVKRGIKSAYVERKGNLTETSEIWLLYPLNDEMCGHSEIKFESEDGTTVRLHFVDVAHIEETLSELREKLEVQSLDDNRSNGEERFYASF